MKIVYHPPIVNVLRFREKVASLTEGVDLRSAVHLSPRFDVMCLLGSMYSLKSHRRRDGRGK